MNYIDFKETPIGTVLLYTIGDFVGMEYKVSRNKVRPIGDSWGNFLGQVERRISPEEIKLRAKAPLWLQEEIYPLKFKPSWGTHGEKVRKAKLEVVCPMCEERKLRAVGWIRVRDYGRVAVYKCPLCGYKTTGERLRK